LRRPDAVRGALEEAERALKRVYSDPQTLDIQASRN
jgi:hypothetical protein